MKTHFTAQALTTNPCLKPHLSHWWCSLVMMMSSHTKLELMLVQHKSWIQKQYHGRKRSIQAHSINLKLHFKVHQTEKSMCERFIISADPVLIYQPYRSRALAWACRRVAVSVWEPCMAMEMAVWPSWRIERKKSQMKFDTRDKDLLIPLNFSQTSSIQNQLLDGFLSTFVRTSAAAWGWIPLTLVFRDTTAVAVLNLPVWNGGLW